MSSPKKCLICFKASVDWSLEEPPKEKLSDQLRVIFILETLLKVPGHVLCKYLSEGDNPSGWISTCNRCSLLVDEAFFVNSQINQLAKKLHAFSEKARNEVKKTYSVCSQHGFRKSRKTRVGHIPIREVTQEIRDLVVQSPEQDDFEIALAMEQPITITKIQSGNIPVMDFNFDSAVPPAFSPDREGIISNVLDEDPMNLSGNEDDGDVFNGNALASPSDSLPIDFIKEEIDMDSIFPKDEDVQDNGNDKDFELESNETDGSEDLEKDTKDPLYSPEQSLRSSRRKSVPTLKRKEMSGGSLECGICHHKMRNHKTLTEHRRRIHKLYQQSSVEIDNNASESSSSSLKCPKCSKEYLTTESLYNHKLRVHGLLRERILPPSRDTCEVCQKQFKSWKSLLDHRRKVHNLSIFKREAEKSNTTVFKCKNCNDEFDTNYDRVKHELEAHGINSRAPKPDKYVCDICNMEFSNYKTFGCHRRRKHKIRVYNPRTPDPNGPKPWKCSKCKESFKLDTERDQHEQAIHQRELQPEEMKFSCHLCPAKSYIAMSDLKLHKIIDHKDEIFYCDQCQHSRLYDSKEDLQVHIRRVHMGSKRPYKCPTCGLGCHSKSQLINHTQTHTKERLFVCEICAKTFTTITYLNYHKLKFHTNKTDPNPLKCPECGKIFSTVSYLTRHKTTVHLKMHKFICEVCGQGRQFACEMEVHMLRHRNERPHACSYSGCDAKFHTKSSLTLHIRIKHTKEKNHKCTFCDKAFSAAQDCRRHEAALHSDLTPFECQICHKKFKLRDYLRSHMNSHKSKVPRPKKAKVDSSKDDEPELQTMGTSETSENNVVPQFTLVTGPSF